VDKFLAHFAVEIEQMNHLSLNAGFRLENTGYEFQYKRTKEYLPERITDFTNNSCLLVDISVPTDVRPTYMHQCIGK